MGRSGFTRGALIAAALSDLAPLPVALVPVLSFLDFLLLAPAFPPSAVRFCNLVIPHFRPSYPQVYGDLKGLLPLFYENRSPFKSPYTANCATRSSLSTLL
jgi:hypothetical protein